VFDNALVVDRMLVQGMLLMDRIIDWVGKNHVVLVHDRQSPHRVVGHSIVLLHRVLLDSMKVVLDSGNIEGALYQKNRIEKLDLTN